jgi:hypothetical protein
MLDEINVSKSKDQIVNIRVDVETKNYLKMASKELNTTVSAYILQLIENDKNDKIISIILDDDVYHKIKNIDKMLSKSTLINNLLRGFLNGN